MFRKILIDDSVCITLASDNHMEDSLSVLNEKYINKLIPDCGIGIKTLNIQRIIETHLLEDCFFIKMIVQIIVFQPIEGEILECNIKKQTESGLIAEHLILGEILINKFFPNTVTQRITAVNSTDNSLFWCWNYKETKFIFRNQQRIRCKIHKIEYMPFLIEARVDEMGLGSLDWW